MSWQPNPKYKKPEPRPDNSSQWVKELERTVIHGKAKETFFNQPVHPKKDNLNEAGLVEWDHF